MSHNSFRNLLKSAHQLGFDFLEFDGNGHPKLKHRDTGDTVTVAYTPSDWRSHKNSIALLERISGRKLPRPKAGHYRHTRVQSVKLKRTRAEAKAADTVDRLLTETQALQQQWDRLVTEPSTRENADEARGVLARYDHLRTILAGYHRILPPITGVQA